MGDRDKYKIGQQIMAVRIIQRESVGCSSACTIKPAQLAYWMNVSEDEVIRLIHCCDIANINTIITDLVIQGQDLNIAKFLLRHTEDILLGKKIRSKIDQKYIQSYYEKLCYSITEIRGYGYDWSVVGQMFQITDLESIMEQMREIKFDYKKSLKEEYEEFYNKPLDKITSEDVEKSDLVDFGEDVGGEIIK